MSESLFDARLACSIVDRTMQIIHCNVNVMGANGRIIGSGDPARIGEMHEGALLALTQQRIVTIDDASMHSLYGVKPGINLPLKLNNQIVGVIGLTGDPQGLMQFGELVRMTAEMMLEQARLLQLLAHNSRLREELVLSLIRNNGNTATASEWAQRLNVDLQQPRVAMVVELESGQLGVTSAMSELQQLQSLLLESGQDDLMAIVSLTEMVVLRPAHLHAERWEPKAHKQRMERLYQRLQQGSSLKVRLALGNYFPGAGGVERSYRTAKAAMKVGKQRMPEVHCYDYQDSKLPVLLDSLADGWQAAELVSPLKRLKAMDENGVYRKTLRAWFRHDLHASTTAKALYIHKNTLDYRLKRIADLTGLNLSKLDDRFLLYVADQLDND